MTFLCMQASIRAELIGERAEQAARRADRAEQQADEHRETIRELRAQIKELKAGSQKTGGAGEGEANCVAASKKVCVQDDCGIVDYWPNCCDLA